MAQRITVHRAGARKTALALRVDRIGLIEDISDAFKDGTQTQIQYAMPNGAKYVNVVESFADVLRAIKDATS
jgi:hypothetical protein